MNAPDFQADTIYRVPTNAAFSIWSIHEDTEFFREVFENFLAKSFDKSVKSVNSEVEEKRSFHYSLALHGTIYQSSLFGEQLRVDRTIHLTLSEPSVTIADTITNTGDTPAPLMLLYHINLGYPLIQAGTQLYAQHENVYPRDAEAKAGYATWSQYEAGSAGYPEQVFYHHMRGYPYEDDYASTRVMLSNADEDFGLHLDWDAKTLPYFSQWKNTRQGIYVCGIEPANCVPEGLNAARKNKRLAMLQPGEKMEAYCSMEILDGVDRIKMYKDIVPRFQRKGTALPNCHLDDYAQFAQQE